MIATRRSVGQLIFLIASIVGMAIAVYLILVHYDQQNVPLVCSTRGFIDCENVLNSSYSVVPGTAIPISLPGLLWFLIAAVMAFYGLRSRSSVQWLLLSEVVWCVLGMLTAFYLVYVELVRLHTLCAWCTALHVLILTLFITSIFQLQRAGADDEWEEEEVEATLPPVSSKRR
ncbi:MAG TPA: vitamin K epoxide reductase family protein [Ktedonobacteraceae bacterium]|jgi:uncharacterized membrane protein